MLIVNSLHRQVTSQSFLVYFCLPLHYFGSIWNGLTVQLRLALFPFLLPRCPRCWNYKSGPPLPSQLSEGYGNRPSKGPCPIPNPLLLQLLGGTHGDSTGWLHQAVVLETDIVYSLVTAGLTEPRWNWMPKDWVAVSMTVFYMAAPHLTISVAEVLNTVSCMLWIHSTTNIQHSYDLALLWGTAKLNSFVTSHTVLSIVDPYPLLWVLFCSVC